MLTCPWTTSWASIKTLLKRLEGAKVYETAADWKQQ